MARPKTPTALKLITGQDKRNPQRFTDAHLEPVAKAGIGSAPDYFDEIKVGIWDELVGIAPAGVMGDADRTSLELLVKLVQIMRYDFDELTGAQMVRLDSLLGKFGMTPSGRASIKLPEKPKTGGFTDL